MTRAASWSWRRVAAVSIGVGALTGLAAVTMGRLAGSDFAVPHRPSGTSEVNSVALPSAVPSSPRSSSQAPRPSPTVQAPSPTVPPPSPTVPRLSTTFRAADGTFAVTLPAPWELATGADADTMYLTRPAEEVLIRHAGANGRLRTCDAAAGPWETCRVIHPAGLDAFADAIGLASVREAGCPVAPTVGRRSQVLDGVPAIVLHVRTCEFPRRRSEAVTYILAMPDGVPFLIRVWSSKEEGVVGVGDALAGFAFTR